jgi:iron-only hydrogenase group A
VRASIGEEFALPVGSDVTGEMYTALRQLGFDYIFDVNFGADITTMVEARELVERIEHNGVLPMFTSCCPAWVKFVEFYYPDLISHLTTSRSPQIHSGGVYKTWWAKEQKIDPEKIVVISLMPCTSKKYEAGLEKMNLSLTNSQGKNIKVKPVDFVLTTRETAALLKKNNIDLKQLEKSEADNLAEHSGAAAIYGASGGVMESALRTAAKMLTGQDLPRLEFEAVRGMKGLKKTIVRLDLPDGKELQLKVAVVSTPKNARIVINELKKNPHVYDYIEFMACPGGCIGGGGQPLTSTEAIVAERIKALYQIDQNKKIRSAHDNPVVKDFFEFLEKDKFGQEIEKQLLHTSYQAKQRGE